jgi:hypothetical protein
MFCFLVQEKLTKKIILNTLFNKKIGRATFSALPCPALCPVLAALQGTQGRAKIKKSTCPTGQGIRAALPCDGL